MKLTEITHTLRHMEKLYGMLKNIYKWQKFTIKFNCFRQTKTIVSFL